MTSCGSPSQSLLPELDDRDAVDDREQSVHDVLDPDDGHAGRAQLADLFDKLQHLSLGEAAGDLVEQKHIGVGGQSPGQFEPLAVEQRERAGEDVDLLVQTGDLEDVDAVLVGGPLRHVAAVSGPYQDVLEHGHARERLGDLERAADARAAPLVPGHVSDVLAVEDHLAGIGVHSPGDEVEPGGLARPVGTDDTERFAFVDADAEIVDHQDPSERLSKALGFKSYRQVDPPPCFIPVPLPSLFVSLILRRARPGMVPACSDTECHTTPFQVKKDRVRSDSETLLPPREMGCRAVPRGSPRSASRECRYASL